MNPLIKLLDLLSSTVESHRRIPTLDLSPSSAVYDLGEALASVNLSFLVCDLIQNVSFTQLFRVLNETVSAKGLTQGMTHYQLAADIISFSF